MTAVWKFRLLALVILVFVGGVSIANLIAEFLRPPQVNLLSSTTKAQALSSDEISSAGLASTIAPFRSDLAADYAVALAGQVLSSGRSGQSDMETAARAARRALEIGPHDSRLWLVLALLQAHSKPPDPRAAESLKMSYLTGPNRVELIPIRLESVTSNNALSDSDLSELARGDVRAILTQLPDQRRTLVNDYAHASETGKAFLKESVKMLDPKFVDALQSAK
jgi:hypothetical protein